MYELPPRRHLIACRVLWRECFALMHTSRYAWTFDFLRKELHDTPEVLRRKLQAAIDGVEADAQNHLLIRHGLERRLPDAIVLGYGLCSKAVEGLHSTRIPLVLPRAHDCITLLLGSRQQYERYFAAHPGTYWFSPGWLETTVMPSNERMSELREELSRKFDDPEDVDFVLQCETQWMSKYRRATWISHFEDKDGQGTDITKQCAQSLGWEFDRLAGDNRLLKRLLDGPWDSDDFVTALPGQTFTFTGDSRIVATARIG